MNPSRGGRCQISRSGGFPLDEAQRLASVLENPLQAPVHVMETRSVDPTLGKDSIASGVRAAVIGAGAVIIFMAVYYLAAGMVADTALLLNILITVGVLAMFKFTLTLPGIAGVVLTIGMAVDTNVLIYERVREELAANKPLRAAIAAALHARVSRHFRCPLHGHPHRRHPGFHGQRAREGFRRHAHHRFVGQPVFRRVRDAARL